MTLTKKILSGVVTAAAIGGAALLVIPPAPKLSVSLAWTLPAQPVSPGAACAVYTAVEDGPWFQTNTIPYTNLVTITGLATNKVYRFGIATVDEDVISPISGAVWFCNTNLVFISKLGSNGSVRVEFFVFQSNSFALKSSMDLTNWGDALTGQGSNSLVRFTNSGKLPREFFRLARSAR